MTDPLDVLLVDAQDVDRELLASVLGRWLRISSETRSEEHTSELQSRLHLVCRLLFAKRSSGFLVLFARPKSKTNIFPFETIKFDVVKSPCIIPFLCITPTILPISLQLLISFNSERSLTKVPAICCINIVQFFVST